jgi:hypothetical protein
MRIRSHAAKPLLMKGLEGTELQNVAEKMDKLEKPALRKSTIRKIDFEEQDDQDDSRDSGYKESSLYVVQKAKPKSGRGAPKESKKSVVSPPPVEFSPEIAWAQLVSRNAQLSPFVLTSEISSLDLSEANLEILETQTTLMFPIAAGNKIVCNYPHHLFESRKRNLTRLP